MTFFDRIKETSTSTGTGTFTLSGAVVGYKTFTNGTYKYCIVNSTETEWEVGEGTVASGVLTRTTIEASSNAGSAVNFSAGTKYVFNTVSAAYVNNLVPYTGATANLNLGNFNVYANAYFNGFSSVTASGTQIVLTISSPPVTLVSGSGGQTIKLPDATTLPKGTIFSFNNNQTTGVINVNNNSNTLVKAVQSGAYLTLELIDNSNAAGTWDAHFQTPSNVSWSTNTFDYTGSITSATWNGAVVQPNKGGTGQSTFTDGQLLIGNSSGNTLTKATLTAGSGISISNGNGSISISSYFASLTTTGSSGAATLVSGVLNIPTVTLAGLGGASDSLVMHLAGTETATGVKTFSIGLATTTGDNFMNTSSGNLLVGYAATPGTNTYKLNVNGGGYFAGDITAISSATSIILKGTNTNIGTKGIYFYNNTLSAWVKSVPIGASDIGDLQLGSYGANFMTTSGSLAGPTKVSMLVSLEGSEFMGNSVNSGSHYYSFNNSEKAVRIVSTRLGSYGRGDFKILVRTALSSTDAADSDAAIYIPGSNRNVSINNGASDMGYALGINGTFKATGVLQLSSYTTTSSVPGTVAGLLGFDSSGNIITTSASGGGISGSGTAGQVTYWSGTSSVTGSSNLFWDNTNARLGIGTSSPANDLYISKSVGSSGSVNATLINTSSTGECALVIKNDVSEYGALEIFGSSWVGTAQRNLVAFTSGGANGFNIILYNNSSTAHFRITTTTSQTERFRIFGNTGNVLIQNGGTFTDNNYRLDINGTGATSGALRVTGGLSLFQGGKMTIAACTTSYASLNIPSGTAPTSPANGDLWFDGTNIYIRVGGSTKTFTII